MFWYVDVPVIRQTVEIVSSVEQWNDGESKPEAYHLMLLSKPKPEILQARGFCMEYRRKTPGKYHTENDPKPWFQAFVLKIIQFYKKRSLLASGWNSSPWETSIA